MAVCNYHHGNLSSAPPRGATETRSPDSVLFVSTFNRLSLACLPPEPFPLWTFQPPRLLTDVRRLKQKNYYSCLIRVEVVIFVSIPFFLFFYLIMIV